MKRIYYISISLVIMTIGISSCSLDEQNYSAVTSNNYITSETQYEELVNATYMQLRPLYNSTAVNCMFYGTDIYSRTGELNDAQLGLDDYSYINPTDGAVLNWWNGNYDIITKANVALDRGEKIDLTDATRKLRTAEVKVLRAYAYFNLVETFGGVPIILHELETPSFDFKRASEEDVYNQIVADLTEAIQSGLLNKSLDKSDFGRVDLAMANHLLGKVLLTRSYKTFAVQNDLQNAITNFEAVLPMHTMSAGWDELFDTQSGAYQYNNSEIIFSIRFSTNSLYNTGGNSSWYQHFKTAMLNQWPGLIDRTDPYWRCDPSFRAGDDYLLSFENNDIRNSEKYIVRHLYATSAGEVNGHSFAKGDEIIYMPKFAMTDAEKATYQEEHPTVYLVVNPTEYAKLWPEGNQTVINPFIYKFYDTGVTQYTGSVSDGEDAQGTRDIIVFRTAETRLLLAEAYLKAGQTDQALLLVNTVRERSGASKLRNVSLDDILDESGRELFGEANRWMDLKRTNKLFERAFKHNPFVRCHHTNATDIDNHFLVRPIPQSEIERSGYTLEQNTGYAGSEE